MKDKKLEDTLSSAQKYLRHKGDVNKSTVLALILVILLFVGILFAIKNNITVLLILFISLVFLLLVVRFMIWYNIIDRKKN